MMKTLKNFKHQINQKIPRNNDNKNMSDQDLQDTTKAMLKGKFIAV